MDSKKLSCIFSWTRILSTRPLASARPSGSLHLARDEQQTSGLSSHTRSTAYLLHRRRGEGQRMWARANYTAEGKFYDL